MKEGSFVEGDRDSRCEYSIYTSIDGGGMSAVRVHQATVCVCVFICRRRVARKVNGSERENVL